MKKVVAQLILFIFIITFLFCCNQNNYSNKQTQIVLCEEIPYYGYIDISKVATTNNTYKYKSLKINSRKTRNKIIKKYKRSAENPNYIYAYYKDGIEIVKYIGKKRDVVIPDFIEGKKVIKIGGYIKKYYESEPISYNYFSAFADKNVKSVTVSRYVKDIVLDTFEGDNPFSSELDLEEIKVSKKNPYYSSDKGIMYNKNKSVLLCVPVNYKSKTIDIPYNVNIAYGIGASINTTKIIIRNSTIDLKELIDYSEETDYYDEMVFDNTKTIYAPKNSSGEKYAKENKFKFVALG